MAVTKRSENSLLCALGENPMEELRVVRQSIGAYSFQGEQIFSDEYPATGRCGGQNFHLLSDTHCSRCARTNGSRFFELHHQTLSQLRATRMVGTPLRSSTSRRRSRTWPRRTLDWVHSDPDLLLVSVQGSSAGSAQRSSSFWIRVGGAGNGL